MSNQGHCSAGKEQPAHSSCTYVKHKYLVLLLTSQAPLIKKKNSVECLPLFAFVSQGAYYQLFLSRSIYIIYKKKHIITIMVVQSTTCQPLITLTLKLLINVQMYPLSCSSLCPHMKSTKREQLPEATPLTLDHQLSSLKLQTYTTQHPAGYHNVSPFPEIIPLNF